MTSASPKTSGSPKKAASPKKSPKTTTPPAPLSPTEYKRAENEASMLTASDLKLTDGVPALPTVDLFYSVQLSAEKGVSSQTAMFNGACLTGFFIPTEWLETLLQVVLHGTYQQISALRPVSEVAPEAKRSNCLFSWSSSQTSKAATDFKTESGTSNSISLVGDVKNTVKRLSYHRLFALITAWEQIAQIDSRSPIYAPNSSRRIVLSQWLDWAKAGKSTGVQSPNNTSKPRASQTPASMVKMFFVMGDSKLAPKLVDRIYCQNEEKQGVELVGIHCLFFSDIWENLLDRLHWSEETKWRALKKSRFDEKSKAVSFRFRFHPVISSEQMPPNFMEMPKTYEASVKSLMTVESDINFTQLVGFLDGLRHLFHDCPGAEHSLNLAFWTLNKCFLDLEKSLERPKLTISTSS